MTCLRSRTSLNFSFLSLTVRGLMQYGGLWISRIHFLTKRSEIDFSTNEGYLRLDKLFLEQKDGGIPVNGSFYPYFTMFITKGGGFKVSQLCA